MAKKFSIIIPAAPERKVEILESLKELDYPKKDFHVIVIKGTNPSENRNKGAEKATGEILVFLDDDGVVEKDYLKNLENFFISHSEIDIVGGPQLTPKDEKGFAKISGYALSSKFGAAKVAGRYKGKLNLNANECDVTSANLACKKEVMDKIKFDTKLFPGEDPKFIADAKREGFKVACSPDFVIYHRRRADMKSLMKQIFNYGKVRPAKEKFSETLKKPSFLIPSLFVFYILFLIGTSVKEVAITGAIISTTIIDGLSFLPLIAYTALNILFSLYESIKNKDFKSVFVLPVVYFMIHLSYGTGMIYGYIKKLINKNEKENPPY
ncbi:MAG: glycosyltransferase [Candidatus Nanoarchaeia archaeon]|nr:glycosyltransferase [Candidatus Nanoarchaeia archaeon]MDD5358159.1 glycosyltransferase [Candidatus Nanoarchaeia archaeon]MDD5589346.1 glycosyltransferase [Candidatus Nanoarchaeia archaeon]